MSDTFDAYHQWLGIPPGEQPPNAYRLLGLRLMESDTEVIQNAADRQMLHLRTYQLGEHAEISEQLLNEVAAARLLLLNPAKKAEYDRQLSDKLKPEENTTVWTSEPTAPGEPALLGVPQMPSPMVLAPVPKRRAKRLVRRFLPIVVALVLIVTSIVLFSYTVSSLLWKGRSTSNEVESDDPTLDTPLSDSLQRKPSPDEQTPDESRPTIVIESSLGRPTGPDTSTNNTVPTPNNNKEASKPGQEIK